MEYEQRSAEWMSATVSTNPLLFEVVQAVLQQERLHYQTNEQNSSIRVGVRRDHGTWICHLHIDEEEPCLMIYVLMGMNIAALYRSDVLEYLNLANYRTRVGNFEMDAVTGNVRFRACVETPGSSLSPVMVSRLLHNSVTAMDGYFPGVLAILHSGLTPAAALARAGLQTTESFGW